MQDRTISRIYESCFLLLYPLIFPIRSLYFRTKVAEYTGNIYTQLVHKVMWIMWITLWRTQKIRNFHVDIAGDKMGR
ncbi:hypothetical protein BP422_22590 [Brevibacillus formosus]|uniref:Uncharacterized protein n=1 Tax=Brevibacillus formosus TaxID=54913 RepID=A0A220MLT1_9BACL|nr:hypothetical protein BP422_22590 [Brevibacillus formosus]